MTFKHSLRSRRDIATSFWSIGLFEQLGGSNFYSIKNNDSVIQETSPGLARGFESV